MTALRRAQLRSNAVGSTGYDPFALGGLQVTSPRSAAGCEPFALLAPIHWATLGVCDQEEGVIECPLAAMLLRRAQLRSNAVGEGPLLEY